MIGLSYDTFLKSSINAYGMDFLILFCADCMKILPDCVRTLKYDFRTMITYVLTVSGTLIDDEYSKCALISAMFTMPLHARAYNSLAIVAILW